MDEENVKTSVKIDSSGITKLKDEYEKNLKIEFKTRALNSLRMAPTSIFNIKLEPFCGYDSSVDIFTFKDKFEKLYLTCIQKHHLPDLLENNYLEGLALTLVKGIEKIEEIWKRLERAFGNPRLLLKGKLKEAEKSGPLWKIRDNRRLIQALAKLSYAMTDLSNLVKKI